MIRPATTLEAELQAIRLDALLLPLPAARPNLSDIDTYHQTCLEVNGLDNDYPATLPPAPTCNHYSDGMCEHIVCPREHSLAQPV